LNRKLKILLNYFLAPAIFIVLSWSLYRQIRRQPDIEIRWQHISESWNQWKFWLVMSLMLLNWGLEARKWQVLVHHLQQFTWWNAFKSVLSGCSITMLTPNRIGEYGGRILYLKEENRIKAISLTVVGSISQLLVTLVMGCGGLFYLRNISQGNSYQLQVLPHFWGDVLIYLSIGVTFLLLLFYWRLGWIVRLIEKIPSFARFTRHINVLDELNNWRLLRIVSLSFVRYLVFLLQYILLFQVLKVDIPIMACFWLIAVFYLVMAIAPTIGFVELPVRVTALWTIVQMYSPNELGVGAAALGIWLINLVLPAIIGSILMLRIKIVKDTNE
jgi:hypothetical protein